MDSDQSAPADVATDAPDSSSSVDDKLAAKLGFAEPAETTQQEATEPVQATPEPDAGELSADDIPADDVQEPNDWLELDRKGEKRRVSKEEAKRLAQQGWDYSTNVEALKAEKAAVDQAKAAVIAKAQITPQVVEAAANVRYFERALAQYNGFDWSRYATENPTQYAPAFAQFQQLKDGYAQAANQFQQVATAAQQVDSNLTAAQLAQERSKLFDQAPEWRDEAKFSADQGRIRKYLTDRGLTEQEIAHVTDARFVLIARDAMKYAEAIKAKGERQSKTVPPVMKPGAAPPRANPQTLLADTVKALHQAKDPERKKALLDRALEQKLGRFLPR